MKVFISYRRSDSQWPADRIYGALKAVIPPSDIFLDIDRIPLGTDFRQHIDSRVAECDVFLALIGPNWLDARNAESGERRLDDPDDFVRIEVASALARGILVIPVLLDGAVVPPADRLPDALKALSTRNAVQVRRETFDADVARLVRAVVPSKGRLSRRALAILALVIWVQFTALWFGIGVYYWWHEGSLDAVYLTLSAFGMWDSYFDANDIVLEFLRFGALIIIAALIVIVSSKRLAESLHTAKVRWAIWIAVVAGWFGFGVYYWTTNYLDLTDAIYVTIGSLYMWDAYFSGPEIAGQGHRGPALTALAFLGPSLVLLTVVFGFWHSIVRSLSKTFFEK
jgi:hypothetical protein